MTVYRTDCQNIARDVLVNRKEDKMVSVRTIDDVTELINDAVGHFILF